MSTPQPDKAREHDAGEFDTETLDRLVRAATTAVSDLSTYLTHHNDKRRYDVNKAWHILYNL